MKLNKIELTNYRCFENVSISFQEHITVLVGNNGAGKSTLLDAVAIAAGMFLWGIEGPKGISIKKTDARIVAHDFGSVIDLQPQFPVTVKASGTIDDNNIDWECSLNSEDSRTTVGGAKKIINIAKEYQKSVREGNVNVILPLISYYGTGRLWAQKREKKKDVLTKFNRFNGYYDCLAAESNEKMMLNWFQKMTLKEAQGQKDIPEFQAVKQAVSKCFCGISGYSNATAEFNIDTHEIDICYEDANSSKMRISMVNLSDGYKNTISMIADIAYRMALLNPQMSDSVLTTPGIVIIDEVDLHLHPEWQQRILSDLQAIFPNIQFIVSTHAPAVINSVDKKSLVLISEKQIEYSTQQSYGRDANSILREIMFVSERPIEIQNMFKEFYNEIDKQNYDSARSLLIKLTALIGDSDTEITNCKMLLDLETM